MKTKPDIKVKRPRRRATPRISRHNVANDHLHSIATSLSDSYGEAYFHSLTQYLTKTLRMDYAFVGELARGREETVNVVSACFDGKNADNFNYDLAGTPCEHIISRGPCAYPSKVQKLFPQDHYLVDMGVECYIGVPLFGSSGQPLGLISVMGRQPLRDRETAESVLQIVAARTATEIERQHLHQDLGDSHRTLARLIENLPGMVYRCRNDKDWTLEFASDGCLELTGYSPEDFIGARRISYGQLIHAEDQELVWNQVQASVREKRPFQLVYRIATAKGEQKWVWEQGRGVFSPQGELLVLEGFITDITARKRGEEIAARFGHVLDDSSNEIYVFDAVTLKFVQVNLGARRNLGYSAEELAALTPLDLKPEYTRETFETLIAPLKRHEVDTLTFETVHRRKNGSLYPVEVRLQLSYAENPPVFVALITDITERIKAQAQLEFLAHHDALTRLPNRALFLERLNHALTRTHWTKRSLAVLFLDMDRFKNINDTLGHNIGDSALNVVAQRLVGCVRDGDTVARLGGDEFTVLLEDLAIADDVPAIAQKIIEVLSQPFVTEGREFIITASIGISLYPGDGEDSGTLLRHADTAMYRAKEQGRNKYQFYSAEMSAKALEKYTLETSLRHALERGEFILYYQPQVSLTTGRIMGVEALLRWRHPELGLLQPLQFIPVAEETGLMKSIDEWVMETSCAQAKIWQSGCMIPLSLTVNLSSRTFSEPHLVEKVANVLNQTGMEPRLLELEITENIVMEHAKDTVERLGALSRMGIRLAIDDFGTGYSSLGYLKRFPIDTLKIDKSFVNDITTDEDDATIVTAIIAMGKSLQLRVVAEGVETKGQLTFLREQQCDGMQGYLFSRPVPAEEMTSLIKSGKKLF